MTSSLGNDLPRRQIHHEPTKAILRWGRTTDTLIEMVENSRYNNLSVTILVGSNDISNGRSVEDTVHKMNQLIEAVRRTQPPRTPIHILEILHHLGWGEHNLKVNQLN